MPPHLLPLGQPLPVTQEQPGGVRQAGVQASSRPEQPLGQRVIRTGGRSRACLLVLAGSLGGPCDHDRGHGVSHHVRAHRNRLQLLQQNLQQIFTRKFSIQFLVKATEAMAVAITYCSTSGILQGSVSLSAPSQKCITARRHLHAACQ